jgi:hypothetical protein
MSSLADKRWSDIEFCSVKEIQRSKTPVAMELIALFSDNYSL